MMRGPWRLFLLVCWSQVKDEWVFLETLIVRGPNLRSRSTSYHLVRVSSGFVGSLHLWGWGRPNPGCHLSLDLILWGCAWRKLAHSSSHFRRNCCPLLTVFKCSAYSNCRSEILIQVHQFYLCLVLGPPTEDTSWSSRALGNLNFQFYCSLSLALPV